MEADSLDSRLSRISTQWTRLLKAHGDDAPSRARGELLARYAGAAYRYLLGAVGNADAAEELAQEFAVRFLRGDFHRARPERGRFRNYLKTALVNMATDYHRARQAAPAPLPADVAMPNEALSEASFVATWRGELLEKTWQALLQDNPAYHAALLLRVNQPELSSAEMAVQLSEQLQRPVTAALARKTLQRGQEKFARLLVEEVRQSLEEPTEDDVRAELEELDLLRYCRTREP